jgi:hypothetical protein
VCVSAKYVWDLRMSGQAFHTHSYTHTHVISHTVSAHLDGCDEVVDLVIKFLRARQQRFRELFQVENKLYMCICVCVCV